MHRSTDVSHPPQGLQGFLENPTSCWRHPLLWPVQGSMQIALQAAGDKQAMVTRARDPAWEAAELVHGPAWLCSPSVIPAASGAGDSGARQGARTSTGGAGPCSSGTKGRRRAAKVMDGFTGRGKRRLGDSEQRHLLMPGDLWGPGGGQDALRRPGRVPGREATPSLPRGLADRTRAGMCEPH